MILIHQLQEYCARLVADNPGLCKSLVVADESHLVKEISEIQHHEFPLLVASYPMGQSQGRSVDSVSFNTAILFYILFKADQRGRSHAEEHTQFGHSQLIALQVIRTLLADAGGTDEPCGIARYIDPSSIAIEPENLLAGCEGWSIAVRFSGTKLPVDFSEYEAQYSDSFPWLIEKY